MPFNRPPRLQTPLPDDQVELPAAPPPPPGPGALNWLSIGLPLGAVLLSVILMVGPSGGGSAVSYLRFLPIMLATYLATGVTYVVGRRTQRQRVARDRERYIQSLRSVEARLKVLQDRQRQIMLEVNPDLNEAQRRAQRQDSRLGQRRPEDGDFLHVRIGMGSVPASYDVKAPEAKAPVEEFEQESRFAENLSQAYITVPDAPLTIDLAKVGCLGLAGARSEAMGVARALISHLVTHHWPTEVQVAAIPRLGEAGRWRWMHVLPHATARLDWRRPYTGEADQPAAEVMMQLEGELQQREQIVESQQTLLRAGQPPVLPLPRLVIVLDNLPQRYSHPALSMLLEKGRSLGVYGILLADRPPDVSGACGAVLAVEEQRLRYQETGVQAVGCEGRPDVLEVRPAEALAQALAGIDWPGSDDVAQPPATIGFLELFGASAVDELPVEEWWEGDSPYGHMRAPIGKTSATADLVFDLNDQDGAHGPHGLIGGMTGSGKSEVLKTILLAFALTHNPEDLNFALIDYKGGAAFNELARLPHTVGVVTDIESHATYGERVILALSGEIEHRKRILESARRAFGFGRSHIDEYRKLAVKRPLPRLVLVFDEFAEFKARHPAESKRLISIARQGRSLGVHLVLATQNIEAAVDPEILQNSTFRICLRVSQAADSIQMIGIPDAVNLTRGRGYFRAQTRHLFQCAYAGGAYGREGGEPLPSRSVIRVWRDGRRESIDLPQPEPRDEPVESDTQYTQAQAIVDRMVQAARDMRLKKPPPVWPDPLPDQLYLPELLEKHFVGGWDGKAWRPCRPGAARDRAEAVVHPILGIFDHPAEQRQHVFQIDPERGGGHLLVFGSAGTGKSTLLKALVTSLALTRRPDEVHIYIIDFGGQSSLKALEGLPHVGAVVTRFEAERIERLIRSVHAEVSRRNELFRKDRVDSWAGYNAQVEPSRRLPALYLVLDGFGDFKRAFPSEVVNSITALVSGGLASGLFLIVSASLQSDVPNDLLANISLRLTFHQADQTEYPRIVGRPSEAKIQEEIGRPPPPGRGLLRGTPPLEFQAALPTTGQSDKEEAEELAQLAEAMRRAWSGPLPPPIRSLPLLVTLPVSDGTRPIGAARPPLQVPLGQDYESLAPAWLRLTDDGPSFLIAAVNPQSGKTSLLQTWLVGLGERFAPEELQFVLVDFHTRTLSPFRSLPHNLVYVASRSGLEPALTALAEEIKRRQQAVDQGYESDPGSFNLRALVDAWPHIQVAIDDYHTFSGQVEQERRLLAECLARGGELGVSFVVTGNIAELPRDFDDPFLQRTRKIGCGVLLSGSEGMDQFNNARRPAGQPPAGLPPGRGYLIRRGLVRMFQAAAYWAEDERPELALARRVDHLMTTWRASMGAAWGTPLR
jgi:S-DNA-T family DNA segregation ATPase FtsK/SpoIIIE